MAKYLLTTVPPRSSYESLKFGCQELGFIKVHDDDWNDLYERYRRFLSKKGYHARIEGGSHVIVGKMAPERGDLCVVCGAHAADGYDLCSRHRAQSDRALLRMAANAGRD